jgi:hypothetical protein
MDRTIAAALLRRLAEGGGAETDAERLALHALASRMDDRPGKYDCPRCWIRRKMKGLAVDVKSKSLADDLLV